MTAPWVDTREAVEEGSSPGAGEREVTAEARAHAREGLPPAAPASPGDPAGWRDMAALALTQWISGSGRAGLGAVTLLTSQPPTFIQAHTRMHECSRYFQSGFFRWPRLAWGYVHLLVVKPALNGLEWVTESPARAIPVAVLAYIIYRYR